MDRSDFVWDEFVWRTLARSPYATTDPTQDTIPICYAPEERDDQPLSDSEIASVRWTVDNLQILWGALLPALLPHYRSIRAEPDGLDPAYLPEAASPDDVLQLISLQAVYVHPVTKNGSPYVGFEFECPWDKEHGLGALLHYDRVVDIGGADTAVLLWLAEQDSEQS